MRIGLIACDNSVIWWGRIDGMTKLSDVEDSINNDRDTAQ